jgi:glycosyltransferase involved in cell wall biosynthesis
MAPQTTRQSALFLHLPRGRFRCLSCGKEIESSDKIAHDCQGRRSKPAKTDISCIHRGDEVRRVICDSCGGRKVELKVFACALHKECTLGKPQPGLRSCTKCADREAPVPSSILHIPSPTSARANRTAGAAIRVGLLTPTWATGGVERWWLSLCRYFAAVSGGAVIPAGIAVTGLPADPASMAEAARFAPTFTGQLGARQLAAACDVLVVWGNRDIAKHVVGFKGPVVLVSHGAGDWTRRILATSAPYATHFAAVSEAAAQCFPQTVRDVKIIRNGVELDRCAPSQSRSSLRGGFHEFHPDTMAVGYVGRFSAEKNPLAAARAVAMIPHSVAVYAVPNCESGPARRQLSQITDGRYQLFTPHHVGDVYAALDCLIAAAPAEGGPLVVLEAWAAGIPVVATAVGIIPEAEKRFGRLIEPVPINPSPADLAAAVARATSPDNRPTIDRARSIAWEHFSAARMAHDWSWLIIGSASSS